jgi:hypothetical protein
MINPLLAVAAAGEAAMGLALLMYPPIVVWLLFSAEITGAGMAMSRIAGISLIALGVGCWPGCDAGRSATNALWAMLNYNLLATLYLGYLGVSGESIGKLLWPTVVIHAVVTILFARAWLKDRQAR